MMLTCPECGNNDPQEIYVSLSLEGRFVNDLMANKPTPEDVKAYVLETVWGEHSEVECHACMYHGDWIADDDFPGPARKE